MIRGIGQQIARDAKVTWRPDRWLGSLLYLISASFYSRLLFFPADTSKPSVRIFRASRRRSS